ncbi:MAG: hypothetical protein U1E06_12485 [Tabrizicola sp.]|uniref:hypothetical protein n=1 Tax=Tabrizicola sp. TaxID=2005166 RepID=UPI0027366CF9|nr:hypothetical protein [Tabrizicola sp.]MDP3264900.1 hypothetical protein [Tabrizicola sp.]MDP3647636.1 hypothetical protein [Paracoccaceae bacterium]MDZ4067643.1 hypothetical protein [Tabrizicola sp.]
MKSLLASALALSVAFAAPAAFAGGPVVIEEEGNPEVIAEKPASSIGLLPILLGVVVLCAIACGGNSDDPVAPPIEKL